LNAFIVSSMAGSSSFPSSSRAFFAFEGHAKENETDTKG
jgi:hypothetical protein